jgi:hypothetical protein
MATIEEMKAELARLKGTSLKLSKARDEEAAVAAEIVAEQKRIDEEGAAALEKLANLREAEAWAKVPEAERATTRMTTVIDWSTHKRTMKGGDIESGRGIIIVKALDRRAAAQALKTRGKAGDGGVALYDASDENVNSGLIGATVYPGPDVVQEMLIECAELCKTAYVEAVGLRGGFAHAVAPKSNG